MLFRAIYKVFHFTKKELRNLRLKELQRRLNSLYSQICQTKGRALIRDRGMVH